MRALSTVLRLRMASPGIVRTSLTHNMLSCMHAALCSPAVKEWEKQYQPPVIHLGRVLSVGDGIARVYGLKSVQVRCYSPSEALVHSLPT